eukprot:scaffold663636_cov57-Prasinocladus_malaysianus.AAC.1
MLLLSRFRQGKVGYSYTFRREDCQSTTNNPYSSKRTRAKNGGDCARANRMWKRFCKRGKRETGHTHAAAAAA